MAFSCVQIQLELGHKATLRTKKTPQGFTHDWEVFIRGPERTNIANFVEKVVFYLHKDFQKPKRVVKEAPYTVKESGYGCFSLPIEVYFKNKDEPRKVKFDYDLFLQSEGPPISHVRYEKMTFKNPSEDFRIKLIKGGGVGVINSDSGTVLTSNEKPEEVVVTPGAYSSGAKKPPGSNDASKKHRSSKEPKMEPPHFNDLFGTPTKSDKTDKAGASAMADKRCSLKEVKDGKESSGKKESSSSTGKESKSSSATKKLEKAEKESKKENEKVSKEKSSSKDKDKVRKEEKKSSKEKSKKSDKEKKDKVKDRDKDKDKKEGKEAKEYKVSNNSGKLQVKNTECKPKELKEDFDVKKVFKDDAPDIKKSLKEESDNKKVIKEEKQPKMAKAARPDDSNKMKIVKLNNLFKDVSKPEKKTRQD